VKLTSVSFEKSAADFNPMRAFKKLYKQGEPAFYFESDAEDGHSSSVTIIGLNPLEGLRIRNGEFFVDAGGKTEKIAGNPIENLKTHLAKYSQHRTSVPLPFSGGVVGFMGYDCVRYLEDIPLPSQDRKENELHFFIFQNYIIFDQELKRLKIISLSRGDDSASLEKIQGEALRLLKAVENLERSPNENHLIVEPEPLEVSKESKESFFIKIKKIKEHIRAGDIFQCVLSHPFRLKVKSPPLKIFEALKNSSKAPYYFYLDTGGQIVMGASPEMLVRVRGTKIQTCPIAGTRKRGKDDKDDLKISKNLLSSVKERAEHAMLVDLSRNDIGRIARVKTVQVSKFMQLRKFSHVMHIVSLVEGELKEDRTAWDALFSCFPAGTLSGAPKIRAMQIISQLEEDRRGFYGGAIVAADFAGNLDSCIAIRSLSFNNGEVHLQAGAGIVADSTAEREFQEILDKSKTVRSAIARAEHS
jgi:anthranilate synthase component I